MHRFTLGTPIANASAKSVNAAVQSNANTENPLSSIADRNIGHPGAVA
jgi:hypothetical protein